MKAEPAKADRFDEMARDIYREWGSKPQIDIDKYVAAIAAVIRAAVAEEREAWERGQEPK